MSSRILALCSIVVGLTVAACASKPQPSTTTPPGGAQASGTLTGTVHHVGTPCAEAKPDCDGAHAGYEVIVFAEDGTTVAAKAVTGADGTFSVGLPAGTYVIMTPAGPMPTDQKRTEVVVSRDALSKVELRVDTGVR